MRNSESADFLDYDNCWKLVSIYILERNFSPIYFIRYLGEQTD